MQTVGTKGTAPARRKRKKKHASGPDETSHSGHSQNLRGKPSGKANHQRPISSDRILELIPSMTVPKIMRIWKNVVDVLADKERRSTYPDAPKVLSAIHDEWVKRGKLPPDPNDFFSWPNTEARPGIGGINVDAWEREGLLAFMEYRVGATHGRATATRRRILDQVFSGPLPPAFPRDYMEQWGEPNSPGRLRKMAETLAAFCRNAKRRRDAKMNAAVRDWEADLRYLYDEFYIGKFAFAWPNTEAD